MARHELFRTNKVYTTTIVFVNKWYYDFLTQFKIIPPLFLYKKYLIQKMYCDILYYAEFEFDRHFLFRLRALSLHRRKRLFNGCLWKMGGNSMERKIKNYDALIRSGDVSSRKIVLDIAEYTLKRLDSYERMKSMMRMEGSKLVIGTRTWDLAEKRNIYFIGAGKACNAMAKAVDEVVDGYLTDGIAVVKIHEPSDFFKKIRIRVGGHPIPNQAGFEACKEIFELVDGASSNDLFICAMSGGSSALMSCPVEGLTLQDEIDTTNVLLKSGAGISEINSVRRHISRMNGGRLAQRIAEKGAELIGFNISDAVSRPPTGDISVPCPDFTATPIGPDPTTLADAVYVIRKYGLEKKIPPNVLAYLLSCAPEGETPKGFPQNTYYQINTLPDSCVYAMEAAKRMGLDAFVLSTSIESEAKEVGSMMASIAREIQEYSRPFPAPCVVISAGEAVTTILDDNGIKGHGGPSQEMTLGFATTTCMANGSCLLSIDTEGTDGTTTAAGGITDSHTKEMIEAAGMDPYAALRGHASFEALSAAEATVVTGNTGTNICDLNILYVPAKNL